jgi:hypothetical protein
MTTAKKLRSMWVWGIIGCLSAGVLEAGTFESITSDLSMSCHSGSINNQGHVVFQRGSFDGGRIWYWDGQVAPYEIPGIASASCWASTPMKLNDNDLVIYFKFTAGQYVANPSGPVAQLNPEGTGSWVNSVSFNNHNDYVRTQSGRFLPWDLCFGTVGNPPETVISVGYPNPVPSVDINDSQQVAWVGAGRLNGNQVASQEAPRINNAGGILYRYQNQLYHTYYGHISSNLSPLDVFQNMTGSYGMSDNGLVVWLEMVGDAPEVFMLADGITTHITGGQYRYAADPGRSIFDPDINNDGTIIFSAYIESGNRDIIVYKPDAIPQPTIVYNGHFNGNNLFGWTVGGSGMVEVLAAPSALWDQSVAHLTCGSPVDIHQTIDTPAGAFSLSFDYQFTTLTGTLQVLINDSVVAEIPAPDTLAVIPSRYQVKISDPGLLGLKGATLSLNLTGDTGSSIYLDSIKITPPIPGDINSDNRVDTLDFAVLAGQWMQNECGLCGGADLTGDHSVGLEDLAIVIGHWMATAE